MTRPTFTSWVLWMSICCVSDSVGASSVAPPVCTYLEYLGATDKYIAPFAICSGNPSRDELASVNDHGPVTVFVLPFPVAMGFYRSVATLLTTKLGDRLDAQSRSVYRVIIVANSERQRGYLEAAGAKTAFVRLLSDVPTSHAQLTYLLRVHLALIGA